MSSTRGGLSHSEAAARLGVSAKALKLYEQRGLITPDRTTKGWRVYGAAELARAAEIVSLRALGLSMARVARVIGGDAGALATALAAQEARLKAEAQKIADTIKRVQALRSDMARGRAPSHGEFGPLVDTRGRYAIAFDLPWPWGGERFELRDIKQLNYITGPLGSGKTRLAKRLAETLPDATYLGLDRSANASATEALLDEDPAFRARVDETLTWLIEHGARRTKALVTLVATLKAQERKIHVIEMVEQDLDQGAQEALIACLRLTKAERRPLFLMTRSSSILDLDAMEDDENIIFCPANHSQPICVAPSSTPADRAVVTTCLAPPNVRARTAGMIAARGV